MKGRFLNQEVWQRRHSLGGDLHTAMAQREVQIASTPPSKITLSRPIDAMQFLHLKEDVSHFSDVSARRSAALFLKEGNQ